LKLTMDLSRNDTSGNASLLYDDLSAAIVRDELIEFFPLNFAMILFPMVLLVE